MEATIIILKVITSFLAVSLAACFLVYSLISVHENWNRLDNFPKAMYLMGFLFSLLSIVYTIINIF